MKLLFLDIDGVLNRNGRTLGPLEEDKLVLLHKILSETDAKVVLSSTWRHYKDLCEMLRRDGGISWISKTPGLRMSPRHKEIYAWLVDNHCQFARPFAILDDDPDAGAHPALAPNFFQTIGDIGLTPSITQSVIFHLNNGKD